MALQLKNKIQNVDIMNNNIEVERIILNVMLALLAGLAFWYVLILGNTVFDIVKRNTLQKEAATLSSEVNNLELSYLSNLKGIDLTLSSSMGFIEAKATFATRKALGSLKISNNEI